MDMYDIHNKQSGFEKLEPAGFTRFKKEWGILLLTSRNYKEPLPIPSKIHAE